MPYRRHSETIEHILAAIDINEIGNMPLCVVTGRLNEYGVKSGMPRALLKSIKQISKGCDFGNEEHLTEDDDLEVKRIIKLTLNDVLVELGSYDSGADSKIKKAREYIAWLIESAQRSRMEETDAPECAANGAFVSATPVESTIGCGVGLIADNQNVAQPEFGRGTEQIMAIASPFIMPASKGSIHKLAGQFCESARTGEGWEEALGDTAEALGANTAVIIISEKNTNIPTEFLVGGQLDRAVVSLYTEYYGGIDPTSEIVMNIPIGRVESCHHYVKNSFVRKSPYYQDFLIPRGGRYSSGARLFEDEREWGRIGFQTNEKQGPIVGRRLQTLQALTPHIQEAMRQYRFARSMKAEAHIWGMLEAFQQLGCGAALVESDCAIVQMNEAAERHLGRGVSRLNGRLAPTNRNAWGAFKQLVASVSRMTRASACECTFPLNRIEGRPLIARMSPVFEPDATGRRQAQVLVKLVDLDERSNVAAACLREVFHLTPAEARLAAELAGGQTLKDVAMRLGVTAGTVRGQIKSIFAKTETGGQPELVALLERLSIVDRK